MAARIQSRQIDAFRAVMIAGSVSAAASYLHVTQPAVSRLLRDLEDGLGFSLFDREGGRLVPRKAAAMLFHEVERVYVGLDHIARVAQDIRAKSEGILRIGTVSSLNGICVNEVLPAIAERFPRLTVILDTESTERVVDLVTLRHYDIGLICSQHEHGPLIDKMLVDAYAVAAIPNGHRLAAKSYITLDDLVDVRVILPGRTSPLRLALERELTKIGVALSSPFEASLSNCCQLAANGVGVAIVDPLAAGESTGRICVRPLVPPIEVSYRAISLKQLPGYTALKTFVQLLNRAVEKRLSK